MYTCLEEMLSRSTSFVMHVCVPKYSIVSSSSHLLLFHRKSTFDMFNFLASQHRQLPDTDLYDEEEDEVLLKSTRSNSLNFTDTLFLSYDAHTSF